MYNFGVSFVFVCNTMYIFILPTVVYYEQNAVCVHFPFLAASSHTSSPLQACGPCAVTELQVCMIRPWYHRSALSQSCLKVCGFRAVVHAWSHGGHLSFVWLPPPSPSPLLLQL